MTGSIVRSLLFGLLCLSACTPAPSLDASEVESPTRRQTRRSLFEAATHRFVYCLAPEDDATELLALLHEVAAAQPRGKRIEVVDCHRLGSDSLASGSLSIFGNRLPSGAASVLRLTDDGAVFDNDKLLGAQDVLLLPYYRNPWNDGASSAGIYYGASIERLTEVLRTELAQREYEFFYAPWAFEIHQPAGGRIYGSYKDSTWNFDADAEVVLTNVSAPIVETGQLKMYAMDGYEPTRDTATLKTTLAFIARSVRAQVGSACGGNPDVRLYPSLERIALRTGSMAPAQFSKSDGLLHLVPGHFSPEDLLYEPALWEVYADGCFKGELTAVQRASLVALYQHHAPKNQRQAALYRRLTDSALRFASTDLFKTAYRSDASYRSPLITRMRALARVQGTDRMAYDEFLRTVPADEAQFPDSRIPKGRGDRLAPPPPAPGKLAGMTFAHEGYRIHNGYGGSKVGPSLDSLATLHVNALSIVPYTFQRNAAQTAPFHISQSAGGENDAATAYSIRQANRRGWYSLLKPQIWVGDGWPGAIEVRDEADAAAWFDNYAYWIMHYALLAEAEGADGLCIGTELVRMTLDYPDAWRKVIADIRQVYSGHLTYAANWGEEFEQLAFWEDLDVIGLNSYYPLSEKDTPTDDELLAGATAWMAMATNLAAEAGKPLWLTETGYRSVTGAWKNPHAAPDGRPANPTDQRRCYDALLQAADDHPGLTGIFIWKWPSYIGYEGGRGGEPTGFTPGGKPAAESLGSFYHKWRK